jgi:uncharacterized RDD family membrane protein YckC
MEMQSPAAATGETAGFGERFLAYLIDLVILVIPLGIMNLILPQALYFILAVIITVGYIVYFWTSTGQTPGKMVMGLKVVKADTGELLDPGGALLRYVGYIVSSIPFYLGFFWIIWDEKKEGWHDKIAKTRVIKVVK